MSFLDRDGDFNFVWLLGALGLLIDFGVVYALIDPNIRASPLTLAIALAVSGILGGSLAFVHREQRREDEFRRWIVESMPAIVEGRADWRGVPIRLDTRMVRVRATISLFAMSFLVWSMPFVPGSAMDVRPRKLGFHVVNLLLGWWSFWGPFRTIGALIENLFARDTCSFAEYIERSVSEARLAEWLAYYGLTRPTAQP